MDQLTVYIETLGNVPAINDPVLGRVPIVFVTDDPQARLVKERYTRELINKARN